MRRYNLYLNLSRQQAIAPRIVTGKMGVRDINTGRFDCQLNNSGVIPSRHIGISNSKPQGYSTRLDIDGWSDN